MRMPTLCPSAPKYVHKVIVSMKSAMQPRMAAGTNYINVRRPPFWRGGSVLAGAAV